MSVLDLRTDEIIAASPRVTAPPPAPSKFSAWRYVTAPVRGVAEAGAQGIASLAEVVAGYGDVMGRIESGQTLQGRQVDMQSDFADSLRARGRELRPDSADTNVAEQLLYGFSRGATKIVTGAVAAGPLGVVAAGAEEGMSAASDLARDGVDDFGTRAAAATVQGAGLALAALPAAGPTLGATAALYLAGGPAGFMAQQALTREILSRGGYASQAAQYDPLDPVGLAVSSLIPLPFAAMGYRGLKVQKAAASLPERQPAEAAPAAAVEPAAAAPRPEPFPGELTPVARAAARYPQEVEDAARVLLLAEHRSQSALGDGLRAADEHEAALSKAEDQMARGEPVRVAEDVPYLSAAERDANLKAWFGDSVVRNEDGSPLVVYHGTTADFQSFDPGKLGGNTRVSDAKKGFFFAASGKAASEFTWSGGEMTGSVMPVYLSMQNPFEVKLPGEWEPGKYDAAIDYAKREGRDGVIVRGATTLGTPGDVFIVFRPEQIKSATGNSGRFDPTSGSLTDPIETFANGLRSAFREAEGAMREAEPARAEAQPKATKPKAAEPPAKPKITPERKAVVQREIIELRKRESVLRSLMDCLEA